MLRDPWAWFGLTALFFWIGAGLAKASCCWMDRREKALLALPEISAKQVRDYGRAGVAWQCAIGAAFLAMVACWIMLAFTVGGR